MKLVIIESPYAGDIEENIKYARRCMLDSLLRGEAPFLSHLLYPQVLDDTIPEEREFGIDAGLEWGEKADFTVVYTDYGISKGMQIGIVDAKTVKRPIEYRQIGKNKEDSIHGK
jgi:hypothetical protein